MNIDFIGILLLNFILGHLLNIEIPKEILEFYEKYKDKDPENHLYEIAPFINDYYEKLKKKILSRKIMKNKIFLNIVI